MAERKKYFDGSQKGDIFILKKDFRASSTQQQTRELVKRTIAYMTLGIDVSALLPEMILALNSSDLVIKKMVYLFLHRYAAKEKETALLVVNSLRNDCLDDNPTVRGLALRTMASLGLPNIVEYLIPLLKSALKDLNPYVRKTGVIALLKLFRLSPGSVRGSGLVNKLYLMVSDKDPHVSICCIHVLNEILSSVGGMAVNSALVHHLLNRLREYDEWAVSVILEVMSRYKPDNDDEIFDIFNILDDRLKHLNSAVVLAATKVFVTYVDLLSEEASTNVLRDVFVRLKDPLLTLMAGSCPEVSWAILKHLYVICKRIPDIFASDSHHFFVRYGDPYYLKSMKLEIIALIAQHVPDRDIRGILSELATYVSDADVRFGRLAMNSLARLAISSPVCASLVTPTLLSFLDLHMDHITTGSVTALKEILRCHPEMAGSIVPRMKATFSTDVVVDSDEGKESLIWMLGEYGDHIWEAPYLLEDIVDGWDSESSAIHLVLLTAVVRLFFKRPPECKALVLSVLENALKEVGNHDVHDRALFYYRMLSANLPEASRLCSSTLPAQVTVSDSETEINRQIWSELNTCSVIFGKPGSHFLQSETFSVASASKSDQNAQFSTSTGGASSSMETTDDIVGTEPDLLPFEQAKQISPADFQRLWLQNDWPSTVIDLQSVFEDADVLNTSLLDENLIRRKMVSVASGCANGKLKYYAYGQISGLLVLTEIRITVEERSGVVTIKAQGHDILSSAEAHMRKFLL